MKWKLAISSASQNIFQRPKWHNKKAIHHKEGKISRNKWDSLSHPLTVSLYPGEGRRNVRVDDQEQTTINTVTSKSQTVVLEQASAGDGGGKQLHNTPSTRIFLTSFLWLDVLLLPGESKGGSSDLCMWVLLPNTQAGVPPPTRL